MHPQAYTRLQKDGLRMKADDDAAAEAPRRPSVPSEPKQGPAPRPRAESGGGGGAGDASVAVRAAHAAAAAERREDAAVAVTAAARGGGTHGWCHPGWKRHRVAADPATAPRRTASAAIRAAT